MRFLIKIAGLPFWVAKTIKIRGLSILWRYANIFLTKEEKYKLVDRQIFNDLLHKAPENSYKIFPLINLLGKGVSDNIVPIFSHNLFSNFDNFQAQLAQDCIVDTLLKQKLNGIFIEIGVGQGKKISNTWFLEKFRNWEGYLCEPAAKYHKSIQSERSATLVPQAVYNKSGLVLKFCEVEGYEELSTLNNFLIEDRQKSKTILEYDVETISFNDLYKKYLNEKKIDYLSLDTEGSELIILENINFKEIDISIISVEHNYDLQKKNQIRKILSPWGYKEFLPGVFEFDAIYVKTNILKNFENS